ncbi:MAG: DUF3883 domain-containing protein [Flavobacterium sp.]|uniref:DUF3883 domain-containing protein n=1 Tax=Flavobacterium sp. TaxID=239 RepID=UPI00122683E3|nr:DUF3883 domain-containing protein [Flavobacterium sp.]RZJ66758.1 MAG: DUF3883 domain-containing protein [Flavobacterium sp.]
MNTLYEFINEELEKRERDYISSPAYLVEHYNIEQQNIESYNGRQLLEMIQNADDACENAQVKKVVISLDNNYLNISNNGEPFNEDGYRSIIYSNLSQKALLQNKIGHKGLGFRSILSWSDEVIIDSGGIKLGFSEEIAQHFLLALREKSESVDTFLKTHSKSDFPIATLRVPKLLSKQIVRNKFDTTISVKLKDNIFDDVQEQIFSVINKETLIFLNHIEILEIISPKRKIQFEKKYLNKEETEVLVTSFDRLNDLFEEKTWNIKSKRGIHKNKNYELSIAWNDQLNDSENVVFSYFKTQARFPFPALLHGTFELTPDRNQLTNDTEGHNKFLTKQLADLLVESSLEIAKKNPISNYLPLSLLNIDYGKVDTVLLSFGFEDIVLDKIKLSAIFPSVNGSYLRHKDRPVYYNYPVAKILEGDDVKSLMPHTDNLKLLEFLNKVGYFHYNLDSFISIISNRLRQFDNEKYSHLLFHLLNYPYFVEQFSDSGFDKSSTQPFLKDDDGNPIPWKANIFIQPLDERGFKLPRFLNIRFLDSELVDELLKRFDEDDIDIIIEKLEFFQVKEYSFQEITETLISYYYANGHLSVKKVTELHAYLFKLFKREVKYANLSPLSEAIHTPVLSISGKVKLCSEVYFGIDYGNNLIEQLYSYDKTKILASPLLLELENENIEILRKYFHWLGVVEIPRYQILELERKTSEFNDFKEHALRNYDYRKRLEHGELYDDFNHLNGVLRGITKIKVGYFDDIRKILAKSKPELIFAWIRADDNLKKTLEGNCEILSDTTMYVDIIGKTNYRFISKSNMRSFTKWLFATTPWLPVISSSKKSIPDTCCLSKTITDEFSPFVEKPKLDLTKIADKLDVPEDVIQNYLLLVGVHREISSFSISSLYTMLMSLPKSDVNGKAARKIYREIISNFNENRIDVHHPTYTDFVKNGSMFCQKGKKMEYFPVSNSYYIPTKSYGNNVLKLFPLAMIDSKQGAQKIEKLFGVKRLKDIFFIIAGEPKKSILNDNFQNEIERFKGLIYVLRMYKDTNHEIANRLKRIKIILANDIETSFKHDNIATNFELEKFEYITQKRNLFYISVPDSVVSHHELRESNQFCQSIAEIFSTVLETEEYTDFIHDLYSKSEIRREARLLSYTQMDDNTDIQAAKNQLNIVDDARLSFWRAFSMSLKSKKIKDIGTEHDLNIFLKNLSKVDVSCIEQIESNDVFNQLEELSSQELIYNLFTKFKIDYKIFVRHYSGLDLLPFFKSKFEDLKILNRNIFSFELYRKLENQDINEKEQYFDSIDDYNSLKYNVSEPFVLDFELYFKGLIFNLFSINCQSNDEVFSIEEKIGETIRVLKEQNIIIPERLRELKSFQALLLFGESVELLRRIGIFNSEINSSGNSSTSQVKFRGETIEYDDFEFLAKKVLADLNFAKIKLNVSKTVAAEEQSNDNRPGKRSKGRKLRFDTKNEEQIGFIAELICYHKLTNKYGEKNVNWVSENANRAYPEKFITREAGMGYDMELNDKGKVRFIEVKGTSNINSGIYMSKDEIKKAMEFPERYDLLIIESPLSNEPTLRHIKSPFKFKKDESLFSNEKLKVYNDNFIIKFKWEQ